VPQLQPNIALRGGPSGSAAADSTIYYEQGPNEVYKLPLGNRYEHFTPTEETVSVGDRQLRVYEWTHTTYVAE
jgi:hypothetical protein